MSWTLAGEPKRLSKCRNSFHLSNVFLSPLAIMSKSSRSVVTKATYILINLFASGATFAKSLVFMRVLELDDLGTITLINTILIAVAALHFGLIHGGLRAYSLDVELDRRRVNDLLFSYIATALSIGLVVCVGIHVIGLAMPLANMFLIVGVLLGGITMASNWITNTMVGLNRFDELNKINLVSSVTSLLLLPSAYYWGIWGAIASIAAQPVLFLLVVLIKVPELRPKGWCFDILLVRKMIAFGGIPFLVTALSLATTQVERWGIAYLLGSKALGQFYLVIVYTNMFIMVPNSINNLFFPQVLRAHTKQNIAEFRKIFKQHVLILTLFLVVVTVMTLLLLSTVVHYVFPKHEGNLDLVFLFLPGLIAIVLLQPFSSFLNASLVLRPLLWVGATSVSITCIGVYVSNASGLFSLQSVVIIKNVVAVVGFVLVAMVTWMRHKDMFIVASSGERR